MDEFKNQISERVHAARTSLESARAAGDDYLAGVREGELDSLARLAEANDLDLPIDLTPLIDLTLEQRESA